MATDSYQLERVQIWFLSGAAFVLKIKPPHDYSIIMKKFCFISLADRQSNADIEFLNKLVDGRIFR